ncbi:oxygen-independent coproporphyrinogen III oxidase [Thioclava sp. SK-1]|uniref:oxygen-independent coproporphyrinogen III oxidase n=1 Tax=Thioclava sp. SK-1 TaxID=1889770 RepID=UPI00082669BB|nr:oxygen-independent coproporphyrinogen III oxidase [Thioclava sp. SK-1]OCX66822.1 oxygen-independent coproporphyrinogen III oxidase [Thioclava sp. SK-1]
MDIHSQLTRLGLFDARVPRYTSYPTAPHFSDAVGPAQFEQWVEAIPAGAQISVYLHVPFCRRLCWFCACRTQGTQSDAPVRAYAKTLLAEIALLRARLPAGVQLSRLHWGGGTPTLLPLDLMRQLTEALLETAPLARGAEFSIEIDPNEIDAARMDVLADCGLTRASIGVQDFDPQIQTVIGRSQSYEMTRRAVDLIRERGITSLNADILYGLPHQTPDRMSQSVQKLLSLEPDRVALYGYAHVPWMARRQVMIPQEHLPSAQDRLTLFDTAAALFHADGYHAIGIDHFALAEDALMHAQNAGQLRRNFQGYTDDQSQVLIGLGASAISRFPHGYAQNAPATGAHITAIEQQRFSTTKGHIFTPADHIHGRIIEALMCDFAVDLDELQARFNADPIRLRRIFEQCQARFGDYVVLSNRRLILPPKARPLTRIIAQHFDCYDMAQAGHSLAI